MLRTDVEWPEYRQYRSRTEWEPVGFFSYGFCNSSHFDLMLGFFSSSAIQIMAYSFAMFIQQGGRMRLIINDILSEEDKQAISNGIYHKGLKTFDLSNIEELKKTLSQRDKHFFDCLSYLISEDRVQIKVIRPKGGTGISHTKLGEFSDSQNKVAFSGSCNFSLTALVDNIEHISISCDWDNDLEKNKIQQIENTFEKTFSGEDNAVEYLPVESIITNIKQAFPRKDIIELLEEEKKLAAETKNLPPLVDYILTRVHRDIEKKLQEIRGEILPKINIETKLPEFPYIEGPREYQKEAFINWHANNQKGLFAMATGTGKTITSLNCLLEIYKRFGYYKALILVPTISLVEQWEKECRKFHFDNILKVSSKNPKWKDALNDILFQEKYNSNENSYIIIATYNSFSKTDNFEILTKLSKNRVLLIADEAHNMGANNLKKLLPQIPYMRRIGLSATPDRQFDDSGNKAICKFFGVKYQANIDDSEDENDNYLNEHSNIDKYSKSTQNKIRHPEIKYTFEFSMSEAINKKYLCKYYYFPHLVSLTESEMLEYAELSTKIAKYFNFNTESFENKDPILTGLLLKRKRIIHKAENKLPIFKKILKERLDDKGSLKYTLIYVPEGNKPDDYEADIYSDTDVIPEDLETNHLIDIFSKAVCEADPKVTIRKFTSESKDRDAILEDFSNGKIDVLTSMKCLDEGIDVPRSEMAIFCASTGNPRQFIQRRGRILRQHKDKDYAVIHDLIVIPQINQSDATYLMERSILKSELKRVRNFADLSENPSVSSMILQKPMFYYGLSMYNE